MKHACVALVLLSGCAEPAIARPTATHELSFTKMTLAEYKNGELLYRATAEAAVGDRSQMILSGVKAFHRGIEQTGAVELASTHATVDMRSNSVKFERGVRLVDAFGRTMKTDEASFDGSTLNVPGLMNVTGPDLAFTSNGLTGANGSEQLELKGPVEGWFRLAPPPTRK